MRNLTKKPRIYEGQIRSLERHLKIKFPEQFTKFLLEYADTSILENTFIDNSGLKWIVSNFWNYPNIYGLSIEFQENGLGKKIAFGHDEGGWSFCLSLDDADYNSVYIYRFTDHLPEEAFLKIADSFEEFINGLQPESEVL